MSKNTNYQYTPEEFNQFFQSIKDEKSIKLLKFVNNVCKEIDIQPEELAVALETMEDNNWDVEKATRVIKETFNEPPEQGFTNLEIK